MSYFISYDLNDPGQNYNDLIEAIKKYGTYCKINKSDWIICTDDKSTTIRDNLKQYLDSNDRLFVGKLSGEAAWSGYQKSTNDWLKKNL